MRVTRVGGLVRMDSAVWVELFGRDIYGDGSADPQERAALVRLAAVARSTS